MLRNHALCRALEFVVPLTHAASFDGG